MVQQPTYPVQIANGLLTLGQPVLVWATPQTVIDPAHRERLLGIEEGSPNPPAGVLISPDGVGRFVPSPVARTPMLFPMVMGMNHDEAMVVWGTHGDPALPKYLIDSLWAATTDGRTWSTKMLLTRGDIVAWDPAVSAGMVRVDGGFLVAVNGYDNRRSSMWSGVIVSRFNGAWTSVRLHEAGKPLYLALASNGKSEVLLIYSTTLFFRDGQSQYGFVERMSHDAGLHWSDSTLIVPEAGVGDWPRAEWLNDGPHLFWFVRDSSGHQRIHQLIRRADGTWSAAAEIDLPISTLGYTSAVDGTGGVHFVLLETGTTELWSTMFRDGVWSAVDRLEVGPTATVPRLTRLGRDSLLLAWGQSRAATDTLMREAPVFMTSRSGAKC